MSTVRVGSGLAFAPQKDLDLFRSMAAQGKHLAGTSGLGHAWRFEDGEPADLVFDLAYESTPPSDYFELFAAAGWTLVLSYGPIHIFRAEPGTTPVHTSSESQREELTKNRNQFGLRGAGFAALLVLAPWALASLGVPTAVTSIVWLALLVPTVYTVLPALGFAWHLRKLNHRSPASSAQP